MRKNLSLAAFRSLMTIVFIVATSSAFASATETKKILKPQNPAGPQTSAFRTEFEHPPMSARVKTRWWWPGAKVNETELARELHELKSAGFSGAEISILPPSEGVDLGTYGWSSKAQNDAFLAALKAAASEGMKIDFTLGASWPLSSPQIKDLDDPRAEQEIVYGFLKTQGAITGDIPQPLDGNVDHAKLIALTAAKIVDPSSTQKPILLDLTSMQKLNVPNGGKQFSFTPVDDGNPATWAVFAFWTRPTGQTTLRAVDGSPSYIIDHFSKSGTEALMTDWKARFDTPEMKAALKDAGGDLFGDSLEISAYQFWTPDLPNNFYLKRGYDLIKYLPLIHIDNIHNPYAAFMGGVRSPDAPADFDVAGDAGARIRHDYYQTLNEMMETNHLWPLRNLAFNYGLKLRYQPAYGTTLNLLSNSRFVEVAETESLHSGNQIDYHRAMASSAHLLHRPITSSECCAQISNDYGQTIRETLDQINVNFAGGVNQIVFHGTPYRFDDKSVAWPGWQPFSPQAPIDFSEAWDSRQPYWSQIRDFTRYLARTQLALRQGEPQVDLVIYRESNWWPAAKFFFETQAPALFSDPSLARAGYTYDFVDPSLMSILQPNHAGRLPTLSIPNYKALVLDHQTEMSWDSASRVASLARVGVPIIIIGGDPSRSPSYKPFEDARVRSVFAQIRTARNVARIANSSDLPATLQKIGVTPSAYIPAPTALLSAHRQGKTEDVYFLYNSSKTDAISSDVFLDTKLKNPIVAELDAWNGDSHTPDYLVNSSNVRVHLDLAPGQTTLILLSQNLVEIGPQRETSYPRAKSSLITDWTLAVKEFAPTAKSPIQVSLQTLQSWTQIPELKGVSGIGIYHATFTRPETKEHVILALPASSEPVRVRINGKSVGVNDPALNKFDITSALIDGSNTIDIEIATTLRNRLITLWQAGWAEQMTGLYKQIGAPLPSVIPYSEQKYGITGDVRLQYN